MEEKKERLLNMSPYDDIEDQEVINVLGEKWVFQHMLSSDLKRLENSARNPRTGSIDGARLSRAFYDAVVLGQADENGKLITGTKLSYDKLKDKVVNAFDSAITSFLGYTG
jgi:hypothetical protein